MIAIRLCALLVLAALGTAQQPSAPKPKSKVPQPKLPVIDYDACPGKGNPVPRVKIERDDQMYSSWQGKCIAVGPLKAGDEVTVLAGVHVFREPGRASIAQPDAEQLAQAGRRGFRLRFPWWILRRLGQGSVVHRILRKSGGHAAVWLLRPYNVHLGNC